MTSMKSRDDVLTLLIHLGYLAYDEDTRCVSIPNVEIREEFIRAIKNAKTQNPENDGAEAHIHDIFHDDVAGIFGSGTAGKLGS